MAATLPRRADTVKRRGYNPGMPLTATTAMAARIDKAELSLVLAMADAVRASGLDVQAWPVGGSFAVLAEPGSPFNKLIALGFGEAVDEAALTEIERQHAARGARLQVELATLADPAVGRVLTRRGYELAGFENVLGRRLDDVVPLSSDVTIELVSPAQDAVWRDTVTDGFLQPDVFDGPESHESFDRAALDRTYRYFAAVPHVSRSLAHLDGIVAGGASLYLHDRTALLCGAATLPASRRRGVQSALLRARLVAARDAGCELAVVTTQPGSKSQENVQRAGFELLYARAILRKA